MSGRKVQTGRCTNSKQRITTSHRPMPQLFNSTPLVLLLGANALHATSPTLSLSLGLLDMGDPTIPALICRILSLRLIGETGELMSGALLVTATSKSLVIQAQVRSPRWGLLGMVHGLRTSVIPIGSSLPGTPVDGSVVLAKRAADTDGPMALARRGQYHG